MKNTKTLKSAYKRIITLVLAVLIAVSAVPAFSHAENKTVKVGFFAYPGYHEINDDVRSGYGVDFLTLLQRYTDLNYEYIGYENSWSEMQQMLLDGEVDFVTSARKTQEREELFDFSEPIGNNQAQINVRIDDVRFIPGDYSVLNGATIGLISGNSRNEDLNQFALNKGFSYKTVEFSTAEELEDALQSKKVDAIATSSLRKSENEKTIAEFAPEEFYVIVKKGNTELLNEINYGINQMDVNEGNWRNDLYYNNYTFNESVLLFSQKEQKYIQAVKEGKKKITVTACPDIDPYSSVKNGKLTGIIPDYFDHLMDMVGLPYTTLVAKDSDEFVTWTMTNYTDVIMDCRYGSAPSTQVDFGLVTEPYMQLTTSRVTRKGFTGNISSIASVDSPDAVIFDDDIADDAEYINAASREEAVKAVKNGRADACYVYTYIAEKLINSDPDNDLQLTILNEPVYNEYIYVSPKSDHELCSILNKCIKADNSGILDEYVKKYTTVTYENLSLTQYMKLHPELGIISSIIIAALVVLVLIAVNRARTEKIEKERLEHEVEQQQKLAEALTFTNFFLDSFVSAYYIDLNNLSYQVYKRTDELNENYPVVENYYESLKEYISNDVHPDDRTELLDISRPEKMRELLKKTPEYIHSFRDISGGTEKIYKMQVFRGTDENHAAFGFIDITEDLAEQQQRLLGAVPVSNDILGKANIGLWAFELDEGKAPRMYGDAAMLKLVGLDHQVAPEEMYHAWYDYIDENSYGIVTDAVAKMTSGEHAEVQYPWHHPDGQTMIVRCGGIRNPEYKAGIRIEGTHQDVTETLHFQSEGAKRDREIIEILASEYSSVYYVDLRTDGLMPYTMKESAETAFGTIFRSDISYSEAFKMYVDKLVAPEDKSMMLDAGSLRNIMKELRDKKAFITTYKDSEGRYSEMKFIKVDDEDDKPTAVALGFADKDDELREKQEAETERQRNTDIIGILASEYSSVYYIDLTTEELDPYTMNEEAESEFGKIFRSGIKYSDAYRMYVDTLVYSEDKVMMLKAGSVFNILKELADKKTFITRYRSDNYGDPHYCEMKFVKVGEDENPRAVALGFADKDDVLREEIHRQEIAARDAAVIAGLSDDFGCVVYVDKDTSDEIHYRFDPLLAASIPGWEEITNYELRMKALADTVVHPDDRAFFADPESNKEEIFRILEKDGVFYHNFRVIIDGNIKYYQLKTIEDEQSGNHVIVGLRNVDETVKREMEYQEKLEAANKSKTDFLFNMSHDIRTPMNAIIGFTQLAKKHIDDKEKAIDSLDKIESSGNHLLDLINEVLDMSRVEAGKLHSEMKVVNISEAALRLVTICQENASERNISLSYESKNIIHPVVVADELHINQIVMNILGNAIKYTQPGGEVRYSVEELESEVPGYGKYVLTIKDTGIGMSPEFLEHIYESFSREDKATTSEIQGTGLGMAIVKRLVDYMDGNIDIESEQGKGTKVTIILHMMLSDKDTLVAAAEEERLINLSGKKVLLVEDNELNREIAIEILSDQGLIIDEAVNGIDAVEHIKNNGTDFYDFVLMDIQMPLMDGFEATENIRKLPGADKLPIIALSANAFEEDKKKSIEAGMNDHVSKPIVIPELMTALAKFVK